MLFETVRTHQPQFAPLSVAVTVWSWKYWIVAIWIVLSTAGTALVLRLPKSYSAESTVLVEQQGISDKYVTASVIADLQGRLESLKQRVLSYDALARMAKEFKLYEEERRYLTSEQVIQKFREDISMKLEHGWSSERPGTFTVSYNGRDPVVVAQVTNRIARFFVDGNERDRQSQATATLEFLNHELDRAKSVLASEEEKVQQFKVKFNGELPEQETVLIASLGQLKTQLVTIQEAFSAGVQNKIFLDSSLDSARETEAMSKRVIQQQQTENARLEREKDRNATASPVVVPLTEAERLKRELDSARLRYGEQHPEIQRLLAAYQRARAMETRTVPANPAPAGATVAGSTAVSSEVPVTAVPLMAEERQRIGALTAQLASVRKQIEDLQAERRKVVEDLNAVQERIARIPLHEQQLSAITRDYEIAKANYRSLLDKKLDANVAADMEARRKGERFELLDEARVPERPVKPRRKMLAAAGSVVALLIALAVALCMEWRRNVILGEWELPEGVVVLGRVPPFRTAEKAGTAHVA